MSEDHDHRVSCNAPDFASILGGCPGREGDPVVPKGFSCLHSECPLIARANEFYGIKTTAQRLGVRVITGIVAAIPPSPAANDNTE